MSDKLKHSSLPWHTYSGVNEIGIADADSCGVGEVPITKQAEANAQFIVESVNNAARHTEREKQLVDALEAIMVLNDKYDYRCGTNPSIHDAASIAKQVLSQHKEKTCKEK